MDDDHDARTIHCGNLYAEKISEELLYELFLQAGPLERVSIPKDNGKNRQYGFVTYKNQESVPYAMKVFSGTKLFNRELRLNNRLVNRPNNDQNQFRGGHAAFDNQPILPNMPMTHQFQMHNPFGNNALRGGNNNHGPAMNSLNSMMPSAQLPQLQLPPNTQLDFQALLGFSAQMLSSVNDSGANNMGTDNYETHRHQSKIMHRHDHRSHNQNNKYSRDRDQRNDRRRDRSRSRSRDRNDWMRNRGRDNQSDRRDRNHSGNDNNNRKRRI